MTVKTIKRYANRKLYDTDRSCYITLDEIAQMVRENQELRIIDQKTDEDLTSVTLAQILVEEQKRSKRYIPVASWQKIIQTGGEILQRITQPVQQFKEETQRSVDRLLHPGDALDEGRQAIKDYVQSLQRGIDDLQHRIDDGIREAMDVLSHLPQLDKELEEIRSRLDAHEAEISRLSQRLQAIDPVRPPAEPVPGS